ncbi:MULTISPECIES: LysR substrate-binding domain-containing protein [unclassified Cobetia]|uniref:LysR substrate-binding domain-containing protein n=1 Tax=unclassified Cobetia TaxID=2609414 RepID=UPI000B53F19D|nr:MULTISPECIES: LysR substrate-binding domain-containing protein [unclassified Cobetia]
MRPSLSSLNTFEVVSRLGSITAAADALNITQSAVSHQIRRLEAALDVSLLERVGRGVMLSEAGRRLADGLQVGFAKIEQSVAEFDGHQPHGQRRRQLRVSCLPSVAVRWLIPRLNSFRECCPDIAVSLQYAGISARGLLPEVDVMITWQDELPGKDAQGFRLFSGATQPVASPLYLEYHRRPTQPADLLKLELIHDQSRQPWHDWFNNCSLYPSQLDKGDLYQDFSLLSAAVVAGQGVALCPPRLIRKELEDGTLECLFDMAANQQRAYWLFHHAQPAQHVQQFCDWMREQIAAEGEEVDRGVITLSR